MTEQHCEFEQVTCRYPGMKLFACQRCGATVMVGEAGGAPVQVCVGSRFGHWGTPLAALPDDTTPPTTAQGVVPAQPSERCGPGCHAKRILGALRIQPLAGCDCEGYARQMDEWGVDGCRGDHHEEIVARFREYAGKYDWVTKLKAAAIIAKDAVTLQSALALRLNPLDPAPGIVDEAIRRAEEEATKQAAQAGPTVSIILVDDAEKSTRYLTLYLEALERFNADALDGLQLIVVTQRPDAGEVRAIVDAQTVRAEVFEARHPVVAGTVIWNICESMAKVWARIRGQYVAVEHTEFWLCPGRLKKTIDYLSEHRPWIALGNLRRPGTSMTTCADRCDANVAGQFDAALDACQWDRVRDLAQSAPTARWAYYSKERPGRWLEDMFFIRRDLWNVLRWHDHAERQEFQDVYDLWYAGWHLLGDLAPRCHRLPLAAHKAIHLLHPRAWTSWRPEIRDWFAQDPKRWQGTSFVDPANWQRLLTASDEGPEMNRAVSQHRTGPGGTVTRFRDRLAAWLRAGGRRRLKDLYAAHGGKDR